MPGLLKHPFSIALKMTMTVTIPYCILLLGHFTDPHKHNTSLFLGLFRYTVTQTRISPAGSFTLSADLSSMNFHDFIHNLKVCPISTWQPVFLQITNSAFSLLQCLHKPWQSSCHLYLVVPLQSLSASICQWAVLNLNCLPPFFCLHNT